MMQWLFVFIGGGLGSVVRFAFTRYIEPVKIASGLIPIATLSANVVSCFILGLLINKYIHSGMSGDLRLLLATGFCGGFSTFSTLSLEMFNMMEKGQPGLALLYISITTITGLIALYAGFKIA